VLGALLDLTVSVLAVLPEIPKDHLPRMADFARILRAVDAVMGTKGEARYRDTGAELSRDLVEHNSVGQALLSRIPDEGVHYVTAGELLPMLSGHWALMGQRLPNDWPASPKALSDALSALQQTLTAIGWDITNHGRGGKGKTLRWSLRPPEPDGSG
jgi:hypothetical protein